MNSWRAFQGMDILSSFVAWLLMIFVQACPLEGMVVGDQYFYSLSSQNKTLVVTVTGRKDKQRWISFSAGIQQPGVLESPHSATVSYARGRSLTSFKEGTRELLSGPLQLTSLEKQMLISTDANYVYRPGPQPAKPTTVESVKGYTGVLRATSRRYQEGQDLIDVSTDPKLGLVSAGFNQGGDWTGLELVQIQRKTPGK